MDGHLHLYCSRCGIAIAGYCFCKPNKRLRYTNRSAQQHHYRWMLQQSNHLMVAFNRIEQQHCCQPHCYCFLHNYIHGNLPGSLLQPNCIGIGHHHGCTASCCRYCKHFAFVHLRGANHHAYAHGLLRKQHHTMAILFIRIRTVDKYWRSYNNTLHNKPHNHHVLPGGSYQCMRFGNEQRGIGNGYPCASNDGHSITFNNMPRWYQHAYCNRSSQLHVAAG